MAQGEGGGGCVTVGAISRKLILKRKTFEHLLIVYILTIYDNLNSCCSRNTAESIVCTKIIQQYFENNDYNFF